VDEAMPSVGTAGACSFCREGVVLRRGETGHYWVRPGEPADGEPRCDGGAPYWGMRTLHVPWRIAPDAAHGIHGNVWAWSYDPQGVPQRAGAPRGRGGRRPSGGYA
jgi:hypothetical protein